MGRVFICAACKGTGMDDLIAELNMLAAASQSGPNDDGHIIAKAVEEIERLRSIIAQISDVLLKAAKL